jgi:hypothetical protein
MSVVTCLCLIYFAGMLIQKVTQSAMLRPKSNVVYPISEQKLNNFHSKVKTRQANASPRARSDQTTLSNRPVKAQ